MTPGATGAVWGGPCRKNLTTVPPPLSPRICLVTFPAGRVEAERGIVGRVMSFLIRYLGDTGWEGRHVHSRLAGSHRFQLESLLGRELPSPHDINGRRFKQAVCEGRARP